MFWLNEPCTGTQPSCPEPSLTHATVKCLSPKGRIDGLRSLDGTTALVCLMGVGMPLGSKFPHVFSPTCLWDLGDVGECCGDSPDTFKAARLHAAERLLLQAWEGWGHIPDFLLFLPHFGGC